MGKTLIPFSLYLSSFHLLYDLHHRTRKRQRQWHLFASQGCCFADSYAQLRLRSAFSLSQLRSNAEPSHHTKMQPTPKFHMKKLRVLGKRDSASSTSTGKCSWLQVQHAVEVVD